MIRTDILRGPEKFISLRFFCVRAATCLLSTNTVAVFFKCRYSCQFNILTGTYSSPDKKPECHITGMTTGGEVRVHYGLIYALEF